MNQALDYIAHHQASPVFGSPAPCRDAQNWLERNHHDVDSAWQNCNRPDWMLWALHNVGHAPTPTPVRRVLCDLAEVYCQDAERKGIQVGQLRELILRVRAWLLDRSTDYNVLDRLWTWLRTVDYDPGNIGDGFYLADALVHHLPIYGCAEPSGSSSAANLFSNNLGIMIACGRSSRATRAKMCQVIRSYVPKFPVAKS